MIASSPAVSQGSSRILPRHIQSRWPDFTKGVFELDLPLDMGWISFLTNGSMQKIELHAALQGGSGTDFRAPPTRAFATGGCRDLVERVGVG